ncbi:MAG: L-histidine N(alpha)-methyltransferase [Gammaproteobacteria bacterium]|nr:L-histidine N(alpha)-methyltransferase [Gammaproteobacteria bacterium]
MQVSHKYDRELGYSSCILVPPARKVPDLAEDARNGILTPPRSLPPKYFYDGYGSKLFERICHTPEYYLTRTEEQLLVRFAEAIMSTMQAEEILELGSGNSRKTRHLFDACEKLRHLCTYAPFDVCEDVLLGAADNLRSEYSWLEVTPLLGDYHAGITNVPKANGKRIFAFLGSTIGNFDPDAAIRFLTEIRECMHPGDGLLLGADQVKDPAILNAAYNDQQGITAQFNLNVLRVLNRELKGNFDLEGFSHEAVYNEALEQVEMFLVSKKRQRVRLEELAEEITFVKGERILTEISRKFTAQGLHAMIEAAGMFVGSHYQPDNQYFSLLLARSGHDCGPRSGIEAEPD